MTEDNTMQRHAGQPREIWIGTTKTYLGWSIVSALLFCPPLGVLAIFFSLQARSNFGAQRMPEGSKWASRARACNTVALIVGLVTYFCLLAIDASLHHFGK